MEFKDMTSDSELAQKREEKEQAEAFAKAIFDGNASMAHCFAALAATAEDAANDEDFATVRAALELIELLSDIGYSSGGG